MILNLFNELFDKKVEFSFQDKFKDSNEFDYDNMIVNEIEPLRRHSVPIDDSYDQN